MGKIVWAMLIIIVFSLTTSLLLDYKRERDTLISINQAVRIAARSAALEIDEEETAEKGYIIIDESNALEVAEVYFMNNSGRFKSADPTNLSVIVVNDAPGTFTLYNQVHYFRSNGVAVGYHYNGNFLVKVAEVDDT